MLTREARLVPIEDGIAAKVLDGEAIIVNFSTGAYYSMESIGTMIWQRLAESYSLGEIDAAITARYDVSAEQAQVDVERLAKDLLLEGLVRVSDDASPIEKTPEVELQPRLRYETPRLAIYRDLAELWTY